MSGGAPGVTQLGYLGVRGERPRSVGVVRRPGARAGGRGRSARTARSRSGWTATPRGSSSTPGPADDLACLGWQIGERRRSRTSIVARLRGAGVDVREGGRRAARRTRGAASRSLSTTPAGIPCEIYFGPALAETPFQLARWFAAGSSPTSRGSGTRSSAPTRQDESTRFYCDVLGFRLSDRIVCEFYGYHVDIVFFHANRAAPLGRLRRRAARSALHHFMLEVTARWTTSGSPSTARSVAGVRIMHTLGQAPQRPHVLVLRADALGLSVRGRLGGPQVDDATWKPTTYDRISEWGHHPPEVLAPRSVTASPRRSARSTEGPMSTDRVVPEGKYADDRRRAPRALPRARDGRRRRLLPRQRARRERLEQLPAQLPRLRRGGLSRARPRHARLRLLEQARRRRLRRSTSSSARSSGSSRRSSVDVVRGRRQLARRGDGHPARAAASGSRDEARAHGARRARRARDVHEDGGHPHDDEGLPRAGGDHPRGDAPRLRRSSSSIPPP